MKVKIYTDSKATLDSIASTKQIEQRMLRSCIAGLKEKPETKEVESFEWITDEYMLADILTKEKNTKEGLEDLTSKNKLDVINRDFNLVVEENGEFLMKNIKTKEKKRERVDNKSKSKVQSLLEKNNDSKQKRDAGE